MPDGDIPREPAGKSAELTPGSLAALFEQAKQAWLAANFDGVTAEKLDALTLEVEDFGSNALATYKDGVITIDDDAAGAGWFVDPSPGDAAEFTGGEADPLLDAAAGERKIGVEGTNGSVRVDLGWRW